MRKNKTSILPYLHTSILLILFAGCATSARLPAGEQVEQESGSYNHLLYLPSDYYTSNEAVPLLLFLHGSGERGDSLDLVTVHGPPKLIKQGDDFPFIVVSPQAPLETRWETDRLDDLLDEVVKRYRVDEDRIYVTGLSMGGFGTWAWAIEEPDRFAAIAPICGGGEPEQVCAIKEVPVWNFHGAQDQAVPIARSQEMVDALEACGGDVRFTVYPDAGHDSWTETYNNPELYAWLLQHRRGE